MTTPPGLRFDDAYIGVPPWDIGRPQREVLELADAGTFRSPVLDAGCGTGENALALAARGLEVVGLDASPRAIGKAMDKARERHLEGVCRDPAGGARAGWGIASAVLQRR